MRGGDEEDEDEDEDEAEAVEEPPPRLEDPVDAGAFLDGFGLPNVLADGDEDVLDPDEGGCNAWSDERLNQPLHNDTHYTVREFSYALLKIKTGSIRDESADRMCKLFAAISTRLYKINIFPFIFLFRMMLK